MSDEIPKDSILGYVSAYLMRPLRSVFEAKRDIEAHTAERKETEARPSPQGIRWNRRAGES
jgi:hypothetical protein